MFRNRSGQQLVEYLLLLAAIITVFLAALYGGGSAFGNRVTSMFQTCIDYIAEAAGTL